MLVADLGDRGLGEFKSTTHCGGGTGGRGWEAMVKRSSRSRRRSKQARRWDTGRGAAENKAERGPDSTARCKQDGMRDDDREFLHKRAEAAVTPIHS